MKSHKMSDINPNINLEIKGFWHRPFEKTLDEVRRTLKNVSDLGFNHVFVETFFNGKLIFDSKETQIKKHDFVFDEPFQGNLLQAFIEEGKTYGIKIHAWVENFFIGVYSDIKQVDPIYKLSWILKNIDGSYLQKQEKNYVFLDPVNHEVRKLLKMVYREISSIENLESLHLDYIRYPLCYDLDYKTLSDDTGYTDVAIELFEKIYHVKDMKHLIHDQEDIYQKWIDFKKHQISSFVKEVRQETLGITQISTAVFGNPEHAVAHKMQDWLSWVQHQYIDMILPMAYYKDHNKVYDELIKMKKLIQDQAIIVAGLAPSYIGLEPIENLKQIEQAKLAQIQGVCLFATQNYLVHHFMGTSERHNLYRDMFNTYLT